MGTGVKLWEKIYQYEGVNVEGGMGASVGVGVGVAMLCKVVRFERALGCGCT